MIALFDKSQPAFAEAAVAKRHGNQTTTKNIFYRPLADFIKSENYSFENERQQEIKILQKNMEKISLKYSFRLEQNQLLAEKVKLK